MALNGKHFSIISCTSNLGILFCPLEEKKKKKQCPDITQTREGEEIESVHCHGVPRKATYPFCEGSREGQ